MRVRTRDPNRFSGVIDGAMLIGDYDCGLEDSGPIAWRLHTSRLLRVGGATACWMLLLQGLPQRLEAAPAWPLCMCTMQLHTQLLTCLALGRASPAWPLRMHTSRCTCGGSHAWHLAALRQRGRFACARCDCTRSCSHAWHLAALRLRGRFACTRAAARAVARMLGTWPCLARVAALHVHDATPHIPQMLATNA